MPAKPAKQTVAARAREAVAWLERHGTAQTRDTMGPRYGIHTKKAFGVTVADIRRLAKQLGQDHALAAALWDTGWYEARLLAAFVGEPAKVTPAQMDKWCRAFDNWGVCDTLCFHLFDRTPHAFAKVTTWAGRTEEFVRRAAFALLASLALHDKRAEDEAFVRCLPLVEAAADDDRNFVKKGVSWALRGIGRRNAALHAVAVPLARRLATSENAASRWVGKDALRELTGPVVARRLAAQGSSRK